MMIQGKDCALVKTVVAVVVVVVVVVVFFFFFLSFFMATLCNYILGMNKVEAAANSELAKK